MTADLTLNGTSSSSSMLSNSSHQVLPPLQDAYLPSPVKRVKKGAFERLQARWEKGNLQRQNSCDSLLDILGKVKLEDDEPAKEEGTLENVLEEGKVEEEEQEDIALLQVAGEPKEKLCPKKKGVAEARVQVPRRGRRRKKKAVRFADPVSKYPAWEFGKKKSFRKPEDTPENQEAAIAIQRIARGGMQRLHFKILRLEHLLDTRQERTNVSIAKISNRTEKRKEQFMKEIEQQKKEAVRKADRYVVCAQESRKVVEFLRKKNSELREKNQKYKTAIDILKIQNARMVDSHSSAENTFWSLNDHAQTIRDTNVKLVAAVKQYQKQIAALQEAIQIRQIYGRTEHHIKVKYVQTLGKISVRLEETPGEEEIAQRVTHLCVLLEGMEVDTHYSTYGPPSPPVKKKKPISLGEHLGNKNSRLPFSPDFEKDCGENDEIEECSDSDDDDSVDAYTVHTMDF